MVTIAELKYLANNISVNTIAKFRVNEIDENHLECWEKVLDCIEEASPEKTIYITTIGGDTYMFENICIRFMYCSDLKNMIEVKYGIDIQKQIINYNNRNLYDNMRLCEHVSTYETNNVINLNIIINNEVTEIPFMENDYSYDLVVRSWISREFR